MSPVIRSLALALVSGLLTSALTAQTRLAKPTTDMVSGHIPRVMNNGPTGWTDTNGWKLVYERTVQPPEGDPGMLGMPDVILLLPDGRLIVSEQRPPSIKLYDAKGAFVRTLGRAGDGPGEYRRPRIGLFHDTLVFHDPRHSRATVMTLDGKVAREFAAPSPFDGWQVNVDGRGRLEIMAARHTTAGEEAQLLFMDLRGRHVDSMLRPGGASPQAWQVPVPGGVSSYAIPFTGQTTYKTLPDGSIVSGLSSRYELYVMRSNGDTMRGFGRRDVQPASVPTALRDSVWQEYIKDARLRAVAKFSDIPGIYPFWNAVAEDPAGNIWVSVVVPPKASARFDVFASNGNYLGAVASPFATAFLPVSWAGDRVAVADTDANDLPRIRIFRIDRRGH